MAIASLACCGGGQASSVSGEEDSFASIKALAGEFLPVHPRLHAKGLGALFRDVKARLLGSAAATFEGEPENRGTPCEAPRDGESVCRLPRELAHEPTGERHGAVNLRLKEKEQNAEERLVASPSGKACTTGNAFECFAKRIQEAQGHVRSAERRKKFLCRQTGNRDSPESEELRLNIGGAAEENAANEGLGGKRKQVEQSVAKSQFSLEQVLQELLPTRGSVLESVVSLEHYLCEHVYGLVSRCRAISGEREQEAEKKVDAQPGAGALREDQGRNAAAAAAADADAGDIRRQGEKERKGRSRPPQFRGAIRATRLLLETDAWWVPPGTGESNGLDLRGRFYHYG